MPQKKILLVGPNSNNKASGLTRFLINFTKLDLEDFDIVIFDDSISFKKNRHFFPILNNLISLLINLKRNEYYGVQFHCNSIGISYVHKYIQLFIAKITQQKIIVRYGGSSIKRFFNQKGIYGKSFKSFFLMQNLLIVQSDLMKTFFSNFINKSQISVIPNFSLNEIKGLPTKTVNKSKKILFFGGGNIYGDDYRKGAYDIAQILIDNITLSQTFSFICLNPSKRFFNFCIDNNLKNKLIFIPRVDYQKAIKIYKKIDILLLPSYGEGFPNSVIECMSLGKAVIATNVGSVPDIIVDGKNGFVISPGNKSQIIKRLLVLNRDKKLEGMKKEALLYYKNNYSKKAISKKVLSLYKKI